MFVCILSKAFDTYYPAAVLTTNLSFSLLLLLGDFNSCLYGCVCVFSFCLLQKLYWYLFSISFAFFTCYAYYICVFVVAVMGLFLYLDWFISVSVFFLSTYLILHRDTQFAICHCYYTHADAARIFHLPNLYATEFYYPIAVYFKAIIKMDANMLHACVMILKPHCYSVLTAFVKFLQRTGWEYFLCWFFFCN